MLNFESVMTGKSGWNSFLTGFDAVLGENSSKKSGLRCKSPALLYSRLTVWSFLYCFLDNSQIV